MRLVVVLLMLGILLFALPLQATEAPAAAAPGAAKPDDCAAPTGPAALPRLHADLDAVLEDLYARHAHLPGFVDVHFIGEGRFVALFDEAVPAGFTDVTNDGSVEAQVLPALRDLPAATTDAGPDQLGVNDITCTGIRPGARLLVGNAICTLAFLYTDGTRVYASTAGHCILTGQTASVSGVGVIGTAVYSTGAGSLGNDFALIEIRADRHALVDPAMCDFGGPLFEQTTSILGQPVQHAGHGAGFVAAPPRPKTGIGGSWGARTFAWVGAAVPGDSGSGIETAQGGMMGIVTQIGLATNQVGTNFGHRPAPFLQQAGYGHLTLMTAPLNTL